MRCARILAVGGLFLSAVALLADGEDNNNDEEKVVVLENGGAVRGRIVEEDDEQVVVKTSRGLATSIARERIVRIVPVSELAEEYSKKLETVNRENADELYDLSKWCDRHALNEQRYALLKEVVRISPEHPKAKRELDVLEGKLPKEAKERASVGGITFDPKFVLKQPRESRNKSSGSGKKRRRRRSRESKAKPKGTRAAIARAVDYLCKSPIRVRYAPVGQVVFNAFAGLALMAVGARPGEGAAGSKLGACAKAVMRSAPGVRGQESWGLGIGGMFLCEYYKRWPSEPMRAAIQKICDRLCNGMEPNGGYGHDLSHRPNALGYLELEIVSNYIVATLGMARRMKFNVPKSKLEKAVEYIRNCSYGGGIGYSHRRGQRMGVTTGRTGQALAAFACCGLYNDPLFKNMCAFVSRRISQAPFGHATPSLGYLGTAMGCMHIGPQAWDRFIQEFFPKILEHQNPDGSFSMIPNPRENIKVEQQMGPVFTTTVYLLTLSIDKGYLRYLSGKYAR